MTAVRAAIFAFPLLALSAGTSLSDQQRSEICDIHREPCVAATDAGIEVSLSITPRPVRVMEDLDITVTLKKSGKPVTGATLFLDLSMPGMFMGNNQPKLREDQAGRYRGRGVIPRCVTGQKTWNAFVAVNSGGRIGKASFLFEVQ